MTLRDRAATVLDNTHDQASRLVGIHTDKMRDYVAVWLDGAKIKTSIIRHAIKYLEMIARS